MVLEWTNIITYPFIDIFAVLSVIFAVLLLMKLRKREYGGEIKGMLLNFFTATAVGCIFYAAAELTWDAMTLMGIPPEMSFPDMFWVIGMLVVLAAFMYFSISMYRKQGEFKKGVLTMAVTGIITGGIVYYLVSAFILGFQSEAMLEMFLDFYYPIVSALIVIFTVGVYRFFSKFKEVGRPLLLLAVGYLFAFFGDMLYTYYVWNDIYGVPGLLSDMFYGIEYVFTFLAFYMLWKMVSAKTVSAKK